MKTGPLTGAELEWLDDLLAKYATEHSIVDVSELDGMLTAILSGPWVVEPEIWLMTIWGGADRMPRWANDRERDRFVDLVLQHLNDIAERLADYPEQFEPLFGMREEQGQELTIVEEWCFGYMRGVALSDWSTLPAELRPALESIALHGKEDNFAALAQLSAADFIDSIERIAPAALALYAYHAENPQSSPTPQPLKNTAKTGRNDSCPCGSGKKYKQCCLVK